MKAADVEKIHQAGLISEDQLNAIIAYFGLDRESNRFLVIVGIVGAVLVSAGIILLVSANWDSIPHLVILGVFLAGIGLLVRRSRFPEFGPATEKFGLLMVHVASVPLTVGFFYGLNLPSPGAAWVLAGMTLAAAIVWIGSTLRSPVVDDGQWRWVWLAAQVGLVALAWTGLLVTEERSRIGPGAGLGAHWIALPALFLFCLLQARLGVMRRSPFLVNLAMVFIGIHLLSAYFQLFGSMQTTGLAFVMTGIVLIGMAAYLERQRRSLIRKMKGVG